MSVEAKPAQRRHEEAANLAAKEASELSATGRSLLVALAPRADRTREASHSHISPANAVDLLRQLQGRGLVGEWLGLTSWGRMVADAAVAAAKGGAS